MTQAQNDVLQNFRSRKYNLIQHRIDKDGDLIISISAGEETKHYIVFKNGKTTQLDK